MGIVSGLDGSVFYAGALDGVGDSHLSPGVEAEHEATEEEKLAEYEEQLYEDLIEKAEAMDGPAKAIFDEILEKAGADYISHLMYLAEHMNSAELGNYLTSVALSSVLYDGSSGGSAAGASGSARRRRLELTSQLHDDSEEAGQLAFVFSLLSLEGADLWLLLNFTDFKNVNGGKYEDSMILNFHNASLLVSVETLKPLSSEILESTFQTQVPPI